jgi:hypothetical protein
LRRLLLPRVVVVVQCARPLARRCYTLAAAAQYRASSWWVVMVQSLVG